MKINTFTYLDRRTQWQLEETRFDQLNLLVGVSGVGKTKILQRLRRVCEIAGGSGEAPGAVEWAIDFDHEGQSYRWEAGTDVVKVGELREDATAEPGEEGESSDFVHERVVVNGEVLIDRQGDRFTFAGQPLPKLKKKDSAIALLENEKAVRPIRSAFRRVLFSIAPEVLLGLPFHAFRADEVARRVATYKALPKGAEGFTTFREKLTESGLTNLSEYVTLAVYYLQEAFPEEMRRLGDLFSEIFPSVVSLKVARSIARELSSTIALDLIIEEEGASVPISQSEMSSGMLRTLVHLIEISLSPPGAVIVVDEFENSLGINCMPELTRLMLSRPDCQFILTSHHPYVINNLPPTTWRLVTRKGSKVRVKDARDLPALQVASHQQAFIRLINLPEYEEGIS